MRHSTDMSSSFWKITGLGLFKVLMLLDIAGTRTNEYKLSMVKW